VERAEGMAQVVEHLPSKYEFKPQYCQKKKRERERVEICREGRRERSHLLACNSLGRKMQAQMLQ
jgi:hypothetical protein